MTHNAIRYSNFSIRHFGELTSPRDNRSAERLLYRYCMKNVSGHRGHLRSIVAYSAKVVHHAVPIR